MNNAYADQMFHQLERIEKELESVNGKYKGARKNLESIAEKVCNFKYAQRQLGGPNQIFTMSDGELRDFIVQNVLEQKNNFMQSIQELQQLYLNEAKEKEEMAEKILELQQDIEDRKNKMDILAIHQQKELLIQSDTNNSEPVKEKEEVKSEDLQNTLIVGTNVWDIQKEMNKLDIYQEEILKVIGECGFSETRQIYDEVMKRIDVKETTLKNEMSGLVDGCFIEMENIATFLRRNLALYGLLPLGEEIYKHLTHKKPIRAEKDVLKAQHSSLKHAYSIKDTATILEGLGYTDISIDAVKNKIPVAGAGSNRYVPDIIANFDENKKTYWEVELAHHKDSDFFDKIQKAAKVTDTLYIIAPDRATFDKLKTQIGRYKVHVLDKGLKTRMTIFLGTMNHLKKREIFSNKECNIKIG